MTQEEKAKAYDEAIDLRTWKYIVDAVMTEIEGIGQYIDSPWTTEVAEKLQKRFGNIKQKPVQEIEPTPIFKIGDIIKRKGKDYTFIVDRIQCGYYYCDRNHGAFFPIEEQGNWELVEQNPAWSEEDKRHLNSIIKRTVAYGDSSIHGLINNDIEWLKSLKDRIQPKQEWSEKDERYMEDVVEWIETFIDDEDCGDMSYEEHKEFYMKRINWLKSLRPQSQWKPSESDIRILEQVINGTVNPIDYHATLYAILEHLKNLMEE